MQYKIKIRYYEIGYKDCVQWSGLFISSVEPMGSTTSELLMLVIVGKVFSQLRY
jgi:hypothetical protein